MDKDLLDTFSETLEAHFQSVALGFFLFWLWISKQWMTECPTHLFCHPYYFRIWNYSPFPHKVWFYYSCTAYRGAQWEWTWCRTVKAKTAGGLPPPPTSAAPHHTSKWLWISRCTKPKTSSQCQDDYIALTPSLCKVSNTPNQPWKMLAGVNLQAVNSVSM